MTRKFRDSLNTPTGAGLTLAGALAAVIFALQQLGYLTPVAAAQAQQNSAEYVTRVEYEQQKVYSEHQLDRIERKLEAIDSYLRGNK